MGSGASAGKILLEYDENRGSTIDPNWDPYPWTRNTEYWVEPDYTAEWDTKENGEIFCFTSARAVPIQLPEAIPPYGEGEWVYCLVCHQAAIVALGQDGASHRVGNKLY